MMSSDLTSAEGHRQTESKLWMQSGNFVEGIFYFFFILTSRWWQATCCSHRERGGNRISSAAPVNTEGNLSLPELPGNKGAVKVKMKRCVEFPRGLMTGKYTPRKTLANIDIEKKSFRRNSETFYTNPSWILNKLCNLLFNIAPMRNQI